MITAGTPILDERQISDANVVKLVTSLQGDALYFSRSPLPFVRNVCPGLQQKRHLGIYGFRRDFLFQFVSWPQTVLEMTESLEQLRAVEHGVRIRVVMTEELSPGVDTEEQARAVEQILRQRRLAA